MPNSSTELKIFLGQKGRQDLDQDKIMRRVKMMRSRVGYMTANRLLPLLDCTPGSLNMDTMRPAVRQFSIFTPISPTDLLRQPLRERSHSTRLYATTSGESTHYQCLSLPTNATPSAIKSRYFELVKLLHPDTAQDGATAHEQAERKERFLRVQTAYNVLSNDAQRRVYDQSLLWQTQAIRFGNAHHASSDQSKSGFYPNPHIRYTTTVDPFDHAFARDTWYTSSGSKPPKISDRIMVSLLLSVVCIGTVLQLLRVGTMNERIKTRLDARDQRLGKALRQGKGLKKVEDVVKIWENEKNK